MRHLHLGRFSLLLLVLFALGCSSNNKGKIEGTVWRSMGGTIKGKFVPSGTLVLEFHSSGSLVYRAGPQKFSGRYSLGSGDWVTLNFDQALQGRTTHTERVVIDGTKLTMIDTDGTRLTFEKMN